MTEHRLALKRMPAGSRLWIVPVYTCGWRGGYTSDARKAADQHRKHARKATTKGTK